MRYLKLYFLIAIATLLSSNCFAQDIRAFATINKDSIYAGQPIDYNLKINIPNGYITGLSKIARVVDVFARRLQVQERMTTQIKECIQDTLNPLGVMVVIEAEHLCMQMRGVEKQHAITTTSDFTGAFNRPETREEFMNLI